MLLKWPQKSPYIWATVLIKFVTKHFLKNRPIWSHCCQGNCLNQRDLRSKLGFSKCWVGFVFAMKISFVLSFYLFSLSLSLNLKFDSKLKNSFECYTLRRRSSKPSSSNQVLICRPSWCLKTMFKVGQWFLWRSWQSSRFRYRRTRVQIQSSVTFIEHLLTANCLKKRRQIKKKRPGTAHLKKTMFKVIKSKWKSSHVSSQCMCILHMGSLVNCLCRNLMCCLLKVWEYW